MKPNFLVETALLAHGLPSASNSDILSSISDNGAIFAWVHKGQIINGTIDEFLHIRNKGLSLIRINHTLLEKVHKEGLSGILTASGTIAVCKKLGIPLAVSCGIGGIGTRENEKNCHDIDALACTGVSLIATSPKDMFDIKVTLNQIKEKGISVYGNNTNSCTGYMFSVANESIMTLTDSTSASTDGHTLILNPIPENKRVYDADILKKAISKGLEAEQKGEYYHPAVNKEIDRLTNGYSTKIQLMSLADNIRLAHKLTSR